MKITKLDKQKKTAGRYSLDVDNKFCCGIDEALIVELGIFQGKEVTEQELGKIKDADDYKKCMNKAFTLLSIRMNSEVELRKKLILKYSKISVNKTILRLKELGYIDDVLFINNWIGSREISRGKFLLTRELSQKGIDKKLIDNYFESRDKEMEVKNALDLINKKKWPEMTREERYQKIGGYLSRRGFDYETIKKVING